MGCGGVGLEQEGRRLVKSALPVLHKRLWLGQLSRMSCSMSRWLRVLVPPVSLFIFITSPRCALLFPQCCWGGVV